jgi:hypothetical protein
MNIILKKAALTAVTASLVLGLSGCLVNRAAEVKSQFCDFDSNFSLRFAESAEIDIHHPVMLDKDILWLADADPTETHISGNEKHMIFVMEKSGPNPDPADEIRVELGFELLDSKYKLAKIQFDPKLNAMMNPDVMDQASIEAGSKLMCETGYSLTSTEVEFDLSGQSFDDLPKRQEILELLGPPLELDAVADSLTYEYHLKGSQDDPFKTRFTVWFDDSGQNLARMESRYSHFQTSTDFLQKKMLVQLRMRGS